MTAVSQICLKNMQRSVRYCWSHKIHKIFFYAVDVDFYLDRLKDKSLILLHITYILSFICKIYKQYHWYTIIISLSTNKAYFFTLLYLISTILLTLSRAFWKPFWNKMLQTFTKHFANNLIMNIMKQSYSFDFWENYFKTQRHCKE